MSDVEAEKREEITFVSTNRPAARNAVDGPTAALLADDRAAQIALQSPAA